MKSYLTTLLLFIFSLFGSAQVIHFDSIYDETVKDLIVVNPERALLNVEYLNAMSESNSEKLIAILLKADSLRVHGIKHQAISTLNIADSIATIEEDYISLTKINILIATIYREVKLQKTGTEYLDKARLMSDKIENKNLKLEAKGLIEQESAYGEKENKNYQNSIEHIRKSNTYFRNAKGKVPALYLLSMNSSIIAENYIKLNKADSAFFYLHKSISYLEKTKTTSRLLRGNIYKGFGETYFSIKSYDEAEIYFLKAKDIADESNFMELKIKVNHLLSKLYKKLSQNDQYIKYNEAYIDLMSDDIKSRKIIADKLVNKLHQNDLKRRIKKRNKRYITIASISSLSILIILMSTYIYRRKRNYKKFQAFLVEKWEYDSFTKSPKKTDDDKNYMSDEKALSILKSLTKLEESEFFLDKQISLNVLSAKMGINQRYLTYVIKKHYETDFASYVNELRIDYIIKQLKNNPKYLKYKISYLAEECGFSSHSRFTINFKKVTGTTPSVFINYISKENKNKADKSNKKDTPDEA